MTGSSKDRIVVTWALRRDEHRALFEALAAIQKGPQRAAKLRALIFIGFERDGNRRPDAEGHVDPPRMPAGAVFDELLDGRVE